MRQICAQRKRNRQRSHISPSRSEREKEILHGRPTVREVKRKEQDLEKMVAKGGFTLTRLVSSVRGVLSILNRTENFIDGNVMALAAEDESSHVVGLKWKYQLTP